MAGPVERSQPGRSGEGRCSRALGCVAVAYVIAFAALSAALAGALQRPPPAADCPAFRHAVCWAQAAAALPPSAARYLPVVHLPAIASR